MPVKEISNTGSPDVPFRVAENLADATLLSVVNFLGKKRERGLVMPRSNYMSHLQFVYDEDVLYLHSHILWPLKCQVGGERTLGPVINNEEEGGGGTKWEYSGSKTFCLPPPSKQGKTFGAPPLKGWKLFPPPSVWLKHKCPTLKLPLNFVCPPPILDG